MSEKQAPLVSIVVASYNHRPYVGRAVESLISQDYAPLEVIVIDDGSTDGSPEFLEELREKYDFRLIKRKNGGLVSVVNLGIREARGEYVIFHASDDESLPGRVRAQLEVLERYPRAAFVSGNAALVTEGGNGVGTLLKVSGQERELGFDDLFSRRAQAASVACMYRAAALHEMGDLDERVGAEDPQIFLRLTWMGYSWVQWAGSPVVSYRLLASSMSRTILPFLFRQYIDWVNVEFSSHPLYPKVIAGLRTSLFSALAEQDKKMAIKVMFSGGLDLFSLNFLRAFFKLLLPKKWHHIFKKAGRTN